MNTGSRPVRVSEPHVPKRRASASLRVVGSLFFIIVIASIAAGAVGFLGYQEFTLPGPLAETKIFEIEKGLSTPDIAAKLEEAGIISDDRVFTAAAYLTGSRGRLKAGEYEFAAAASMREVMNLLVAGKSIVYKISIPEGWTSDMALARIAENPVLSGEVNAPPAEGAIMPDTYVFRRGMTRQKLIEDMQAAQLKLLDEIWATRKSGLAIRTKEEAVILASMVEKETGLANERPMIASVFMNRLARGMRLQSDPTIIYGIAGGAGKLDRPLTDTDITTPTPYNTYTIDGLPPGPIANPGRAALEAVVNPPESEYIYFVADGTGGHAFAATLDEHNRNVAKWRDLAGNAAIAAAAEPVVTEQPPAADAASAKEAATLPEIEPEAAAPVALPGAAAPDSTVKAPEAAKPAETTAAAGPAKVPETTKKPDPPPAGAVAQFKPGSVIVSGDTLIPIPKRKPKR